MDSFRLEIIDDERLRCAHCGDHQGKPCWRRCPLCYESKWCCFDCKAADFAKHISTCIDNASNQIRIALLTAEQCDTKDMGLIKEDQSSHHRHWIASSCFICNQKMWIWSPSSLLGPLSEDQAIMSCIVVHVQELSTAAKERVLDEVCISTCPECRSPEICSALQMDELGQVRLSSLSGC